MNDKYIIPKKYHKTFSMEFIQENTVTLITGLVTFVIVFGYLRWDQSRKRSTEYSRANEFVESLQAGANIPDDVPATFACSTTKTFVKGKGIEDCEYEHEDFYMGFRTKNSVVQEIWY